LKDAIATDIEKWQYALIIRNLILYFISHDQYTIFSQESTI
jgi:hypothetical protein